MLIQGASWAVRAPPLARGLGLHGVRKPVQLTQDLVHGRLRGFPEGFEEFMLSEEGGAFQVYMKAAILGTHTHAKRKTALQAIWPPRECQ